MKKIILVLVLFLSQYSFAAEFLIYKGPHWIDKLTPQEITIRLAADPNFQRNIDGHLRRGDILEVQSDGKWPNHGITTPFYTLKIPGLDPNVAKKYMRPLLQDPNDPNSLILKRRKWKMLIEDLPSNIKQTIKNTHVLVTTWQKVKNYVKAKI